jgi:hypothetical protein
MLSLLGCSDSFTKFNGQSEETDAGGYRPDSIYHVTEREKDATPESQRDAGAAIQTSSIDSGSQPNEPIRIQDSGRPKDNQQDAQKEAQVMKPWWESNPEGVCVAGNPKQCASGCSCVHNGQAWCCI